MDRIRIVLSGRHTAAYWLHTSVNTYSNLSQAFQHYATHSYTIISMIAHRRSISVGPTAHCWQNQFRHMSCVRLFDMSFVWRSPLIVASSLSATRHLRRSTGVRQPHNTFDTSPPSLPASQPVTQNCDRNVMLRSHATQRGQNDPTRAERVNSATHAKITAGMGGRQNASTERTAHAERTRSAQRIPTATHPFRVDDRRQAHVIVFLVSATRSPIANSERIDAMRCDAMRSDAMNRVPIKRRSHRRWYFCFRSNVRGSESTICRPAHSFHTYHLRKVSKLVYWLLLMLQLLCVRVWISKCFGVFKFHDELFGIISCVFFANVCRQIECGFIFVLIGLRNRGFSCVLWCLCFSFRNNVIVRAQMSSDSLFQTETTKTTTTKKLVFN